MNKLIVPAVAQAVMDMGVSVGVSEFWVFWVQNK